MRKKVKIQYIVATLAIITMIAISLTVSLSKNVEEKKAEEISSFTLEELPIVNDFDTLYSLITFKEEKEINQTKNTIIENTIQTDNPVVEQNENESNPEQNLTEKIYNNYKYTIENGNIIITNIEDTENPKVAKEIPIVNAETEKFTPLSISVNENKLILSGKKETYKEIIEQITNEETGELEENKKYEYENTYATAKVYNIENVKKAKLIREIDIEGDYFISKVYEENLYLVSRKNIDTEKYKNIKKEEINQEEFKIKYKDSNEKEFKLIEFNEMYYIPNTINNDYLNVISINLNTEEKSVFNSFIGTGSNITFIEDSVNIEVKQDEYKDVTLYGYYDNTQEIKYIYRLKLENGKIVYKKIEKAQ